MLRLHHGVNANTPLSTVARAIWDGTAILGTDSSVYNNKATYSWILSTSQTKIAVDVCGGGFLPPPAKYMEHSLKHPEAAAIYAGLTWIRDLLKCYPHPNINPVPSLPVLIDNMSVITDIQRPVNDLTPTFQYLRPDYDILQGI